MRRALLLVPIIAFWAVVTWGGEMRRQVERTPAKRFVITQFVGRSASGVSLMAVISRSYDTREEAEAELARMWEEGLG